MWARKPITIPIPMPPLRQKSGIWARYELEVSGQLKFGDVFFCLVERGGDRHREADAAKVHIFR